MDSNRPTYNPATVAHPGETIVEYLVLNGWTQRDLSRHTGLTPKTVSEICNGKAPITPSTSLALEKVLKRPAHFWLNLQRRFDEAEARHRMVHKVDEWKEWAKKFPIAEMARYGWLDFGDESPLRLDPQSRVEALLSFFEVSSPASWNSVWQASNVAYRQTRRFRTSVEAISAWARRAELLAREAEAEVKEFDEDRLRSSLDELRQQSRRRFENALPEIEALCAAAGVIVIWLRELHHTGISGCTRWISDNKALVALTLRYGTDDQIWFTFFHELAHVLLHRKQHDFVLDNADKDLNDQIVDPQMQKEEEEANRFAADTLIPPQTLAVFIEQGDFSNDAIYSLSEEIGIGPGIVVGRLQREGVLKPYEGNKLKQRFRWTTPDE